MGYAPVIGVYDILALWQGGAACWSQGKHPATRLSAFTPGRVVPLAARHSCGSAWPGLDASTALVEPARQRLGEKADLHVDYFAVTQEHT